VADLATAYPSMRVVDPNDVLETVSFDRRSYVVRHRHVECLRRLACIWRDGSSFRPDTKVSCSLLEFGCGGVMLAAKWSPSSEMGPREGQHICPNRQGDNRERLIDTALDLCTRRGYDATTVDEIAAAANVTPSEFARYFATTDAAIMSIVDDLLHATATTLGKIKADVEPEHALLFATIEVLGEIIDGRGVITRDRMLAMARIVTGTPHLQMQASAARKRVLIQALAERVGVGMEDRRVQRAATMWSAIAAGAYIGQLHMPANYDPRQDDWLSERMIANLSETFAEVMGEVPWQEE
jgi:AcrR family transcriptional regulator